MTEAITFLRRTLPRSQAAVRLLVLALLLPSISAQGESHETYGQAYQQGFKAGFQQGQRDQRETKGFDIERQKEYKTADRGFDQRVHDRDVYYFGFRKGYRKGYEQGYGIQATTEDNRAPRPRPISLPAPAEAAESFDPNKARILPFGAEIRLQLLESLSTRSNERGDTFSTLVVKDVVVEEQIVIPKGALIFGSIGYLKRAGRIKGTAEMKLSFGEVELEEGSRIKISASLVAVDEQATDGEEGTVKAGSSKGRDARNVGTATAIGTLVGILSGGKKGGAIGAGAGAVIGLGGVLGSRGKDLNIYAQTELLIRLDSQALIPIAVRATED